MLVNNRRSGFRFRNESVNNRYASQSKGIHVNGDLKVSRYILQYNGK